MGFMDKAKKLADQGKRYVRDRIALLAREPDEL